jgi:hypothetical protein
MSGPQVNQPAFRALPLGTVSVTAGTTSQATQFQAGQVSRHARVWNSGGVTVFIEFGTTSGVTASATASYPLAAGASEILSAPHEYFATITAAGTSTVYATPGEGM